MQNIPLRYLVWTQKRDYDRLVSTSPHLRILWRISYCSHRKTSGSSKIGDVIEKNRCLLSVSSPSIPLSRRHFVLWVHLCHGSCLWIPQRLCSAPFPSPSPMHLASLILPVAITSATSWKEIASIWESHSFVGQSSPARDNFQYHFGFSCILHTQEPCWTIQDSFWKKGESNWRQTFDYLCFQIPQTQGQHKSYSKFQANFIGIKEKSLPLTLLDSCKLVLVRSSLLPSTKLRRSAIRDNGVSSTSLRALAWERYLSHVRSARTVMPIPRTTPSPARAILVRAT